MFNVGRFFWQAAIDAKTQFVKMGNANAAFVSVQRPMLAMPVKFKIDPKRLL